MNRKLNIHSKQKRLYFLFIAISLFQFSLPKHVSAKHLSLLHTLENPYGIASIEFSPDGKLLACAGEHTLKVFDVQTGKAIYTFEEPDELAESITFSPDGKLIAASYGNKIKIWDAQSGVEKRVIIVHANHEIKTTHQYRTFSVRFSPDSKYLINGSGGHEDIEGPIYGEIKLWDVATGNLLFTFPQQEDFVWAVGFSPNSEFIASSCKNMIKIWDVQTKQLKKEIKAHKDDIYSLAFSENGSKLISCSNDKTVKIWDVGSLKLLSTLFGHKDKVLSIAISNQMIISAGGKDRTIRLWNSVTGKANSTLKVDESFINAVAITSDGRYLAWSSADGTIQIWQIK